MCKMRGCMKTVKRPPHCQGKGFRRHCLPALSEQDKQQLPPTQLLPSGAYSLEGIILVVQWWLTEPGAPLQGAPLLYPIIREQVQKTRLHNGGIGFIYFVLRDQYPIKQLREWQQETGSVLYQMTLPQFLLCKRWSHGPHMSLTQTSLGEPSSSLP